MHRACNRWSRLLRGSTTTPLFIFQLLGQATLLAGYSYFPLYEIDAQDDVLTSAEAEAHAQCPVPRPSPGVPAWSFLQAAKVVFGTVNMTAAGDSDSAGIQENEIGGRRGKVPAGLADPSEPGLGVGAPKPHEHEESAGGNQAGDASSVTLAATEGHGGGVTEWLGRFRKSFLTALEKTHHKISGTEDPLFLVLISVALLLLLLAVAWLVFEATHNKSASAREDRDGWPREINDPFLAGARFASPGPVPPPGPQSRSPAVPARGTGPVPPPGARGGLGPGGGATRPGGVTDEEDDTVSSLSGVSGRGGQPPANTGPANQRRDFLYVRSDGAPSSTPASPGILPRGPLGGTGGTSPALAPLMPGMGDALSGQLCPGLVVPPGNECVVAVPLQDRGYVPGGGSSFSVRELSGTPVIQVETSVPQWGGGPGKPMVQLRAAHGQRPLIASCRAATEGPGGRRSAYVHDVADGLFAHVTKVLTQGAGATTGGALSRPCYVLTSGRVALQLLFDGDFAGHRVKVTDEDRRILADSEPQTMKFDRTNTYYRLRVSEGVDVGLVLCALLSIEQLER